jgi:hypothetical protein
MTNADVDAIVLMHKKTGVKYVLDELAPHFYGRGMELLAEIGASITPAPGRSSSAGGTPASAPLPAPPSGGLTDPQYATLHAAASAKAREVLELFARAPRKQPDVIRLLGIDDYELRSRLGGIAKLCKRLKITYPVENTGSHKTNRVFTMHPGAASTILHVLRTGNL